MPAWAIALVIFLTFVFLYIAYALLYGSTFRRVTLAYLAQFGPDGPDEKLVIWTGDFLPYLGKRPPESAMWRVKTGLFSFKGNFIPTYRYLPDQLQNQDLDDPINIEAEIRIMEAEGQAIIAAKAKQEDDR